MSRHPQFYVLPDVGNGTEQDRDIIAEMTQAVVAVPAQQPPEMAVSMIVIHDEKSVASGQSQARLPWLFLDPADGTAPILRLEKGVIVLHGDAVLAKPVAAHGHRIRWHVWAPRCLGAGDAPVLTTSPAGSSIGTSVEVVDRFQHFAASAVQFRRTPIGCERVRQPFGDALAGARAVTTFASGSLRRRRAADRRPADLTLKARLRDHWSLQRIQQGGLRKLHLSRLRIRCGHAPERSECSSTPARGVNSYSHSTKIAGRYWLTKHNQDKLRTQIERG